MQDIDIGLSIMGKCHSRSASVQLILVLIVTDSLTYTLYHKWKICFDLICFVLSCTMTDQKKQTNGKRVFLAIFLMALML